MRLAALVVVVMLACAAACAVGAVNEPRPEPACAPLCPELFVRLSVAPQTCAGPDGTAEVYVFVTRVGLPPGPVVVTVNGRGRADLWGDTVTAHYPHLGVGGHTIRAESGGRVVEQGVTVYECGGER